MTIILEMKTDNIDNGNNNNKDVNIKENNDKMNNNSDTMRILKRGKEKI